MELLVLATYFVLRCRARNLEAPQLSYSHLTRILRELGFFVHYHNPQFFRVLGIILLACRDAGLPLLPALVCRLANGQLDLPGDQLFALAQPGVTDPEDLWNWWRQETERIRRANFPDNLPWNLN